MQIFSKNSTKTRLNGRFIKKKKLNQKLPVQSLGRSNKGRRVIKPDIEIDDEPAAEPVHVDNRIVNVSMLAQELECSVCKEPLSLRNIEKEVKRGLGSYLHIRCQNCLLVKAGCTNNQMYSRRRV